MKWHQSFHFIIFLQKIHVPSNKHQSLYYSKTEKHSVQNWVTERFDWKHAALTSAEILIAAGYTSGLFGGISILCEQK